MPNIGKNSRIGRIRGGGEEMCQRLNYTDRDHPYCYNEGFDFQLPKPLQKTKRVKLNKNIIREIE